MSTTKMTAPSTVSNGGVVQTEWGNYTVSNGTATVDSRAVAGLMAAGWAVFNDDLPGTSDQLKCGKHTVTAGENTANAAAIVTGLSLVAAFHVQVLRSGIDVTNAATITEASGTITVADNSTDFVLGTSDVIVWIAIGTP